MPDQPDRPDRPAPLHAFTDDALGDLDAVGLAEALRAGSVSRAEVVEAAIARAEKVDPTLGAIVTDGFQAAREESWRKGSGFFAGVPTFVKDNSDVAGLPTTEGTDVFTPRPKTRDGDFFATFRRLGVINLGKSQLSQFGISPSAEGPANTVRNPWRTTHSSGASSAGAAALVASGVVPMAHANDGGGSIRIPAAVCGLVGLKPTRNRVPTDRLHRDMPVRIVADGVVTRSVRDTAAYLRETERLHRNLGLRPIGDVTGPGRKRLTIALVTRTPFRETDAETEAVVRETAALLESMGHRIEEVEAPVPATFERDFKAYYGMLFLAMRYLGKRNLGPDFDWSRTESLTQGFAAYAARNCAHLPTAIARLAASGRRSKAFFATHDAVLSPTLAHVTPPIGHLDPTLPYEEVMGRILDWCAFTPLQNATGEPAVSLPLGMSSDGTPIGVQLGAGRGREARLLELAFELEEARPFARIQDVRADFS